MEQHNSLATPNDPRLLVCMDKYYIYCIFISNSTDQKVFKEMLVKEWFRGDEITADYNRINNIITLGSWVV